jgi:hypothetical protein
VSKTTLAIISGIAIIIVIPLRGFVVSVLWGWFVVPLGVVALNIPAAIGLAMLVRMVTSPHPDYDEVSDAERENRVLKGIGNSIGGPLLALIVGCVLKAIA